MAATTRATPSAPSSSISVSHSVSRNDGALPSSDAIATPNPAGGTAIQLGIASPASEAASRITSVARRARGSSAGVAKSRGPRVRTVAARTASLRCSCGEQRVAGVLADDDHRGEAPAVLWLAAHAEDVAALVLPAPEVGPVAARGDQAVDGRHRRRLAVVGDAHDRRVDQVAQLVG